MLHQLPCVLTDAWARREHIIPGVHGELVAKGTGDVLATKIIVLLNDRGLFAAMGMRTKRVLAHYTGDAVVTRMMPHFRLH